MITFNNSRSTSRTRRASVQAASWHRPSHSAGHAGGLRNASTQPSSTPSPSRPSANSTPCTRNRGRGGPTCCGEPGRGRIWARWRPPLAARRRGTTLHDAALFCMSCAPSSAERIVTSSTFRTAATSRTRRSTSYCGLSAMSRRSSRATTGAATPLPVRRTGQSHPPRSTSMSSWGELGSGADSYGLGIGLPDQQDCSALRGSGSPHEPVCVEH